MVSMRSYSFSVASMSIQRNWIQSWSKESIVVWFTSTFNYRQSIVGSKLKIDVVMWWQRDESSFLNAEFSSKSTGKWRRTWWGRQHIWSIVRRIAAIRDIRWDVVTLDGRNRMEDVKLWRNQWRILRLVIRHDRFDIRKADEISSNIDRTKQIEMNRDTDREKQTYTHTHGYTDKHRKTRTNGQKDTQTHTHTHTHVQEINLKHSKKQKFQRKNYNALLTWLIPRDKAIANFSNLKKATWDKRYHTHVHLTPMIRCAKSSIDHWCSLFEIDPCPAIRATVTSISCKEDTLNSRTGWKLTVEIPYWLMIFVRKATSWGWFTTFDLYIIFNLALTKAIKSSRSSKL